MSKYWLKADLSKFQVQELTKHAFDLSKLVVGSMILKFFEAGGPKFQLESILTLLAGLTISLFMVIIGLMISKEKKKK